MHTLVRGTVLALGLVGAHAVALACSCVDEEYDPVAKAAEYDLVFYGEVVRVHPARGCIVSSSLDPVRVEMRVIEGFKGVETGEDVDIETVRDDASCGVDFGEGEQWLIYYTDGSYGTCSPGGQVSADDPELDALREG